MKYDPALIKSACHTFYFGEDSIFCHVQVRVGKSLSGISSHTFCYLALTIFLGETCERVKEV